MLKDVKKAQKRTIFPNKVSHFPLFSSQFYIFFVPLPQNMTGKTAKGLMPTNRK